MKNNDEENKMNKRKRKIKKMNETHMQVRSKTNEPENTPGISTSRGGMTQSYRHDPMTQSCFSGWSQMNDRGEGFYYLDE